MYWDLFLKKTKQNTNILDIDFSHYTGKAMAWISKGSLHAAPDKHWLHCVNLLHQEKLKIPSTWNFLEALLSSVPILEEKTVALLS